MHSLVISLDTKLLKNANIEKKFKKKKKSETKNY